MKEIFHDFSYVGSFPADQFAPPLHEDRSLEIPSVLQPNVLYIFHSHKPVDDLALATKFFPERLRQVGIMVVNQAKSRQDIAFIDPRNTTWGIRFQQGPYSGEIYNVLDQKMYRAGVHIHEWSFDDYVLRFTN